MVRSALALVLGLGMVGAALSLQAQDKKEGKEETIKGSITCAKCDLKKAEKCATVIKDGDKVYYFDKDSHKKYHGDVCTTAKDGTVKGTVKKEKDGEKEKMIVTVTSLEYKK
jgi:hypothetical protein